MWQDFLVHLLMSQLILLLFLEVYIRLNIVYIYYTCRNFIVLSIIHCATVSVTTTTTEYISGKYNDNVINI